MQKRKQLLSCSFSFRSSRSVENFQNTNQDSSVRQREQTPKIFAKVQETNMLVLNIAEELISLRKQEYSDYLQNSKALHQSPDQELKHLNLVWKYENDLWQITTRSRPKRPFKRARKAIKNTLSAANG